jgi:ABC-type lipoprotein release transport system permease subunit
MTCYAGDAHLTFIPPPGLAETVRLAALELDPKLQIIGLRMMNDVVDRTLTQERFVARLAGFFSLFALLAAIGLYGVMSYTVTHRISEIGIRMALGAQAGDVVKLVMRETAPLMGIGVIIGLGAALAFTRLISSLLFGLRRVRFSGRLRGLSRLRRKSHGQFLGGGSAAMSPCYPRIISSSRTTDS